MEEQKYFNVLTDVGRNAIVNAVKTGEKVNITSFGVGDGGGQYYKPTQAMTSLKNEVWRGAIKSYETDEFSPNVLIVKCLIPANVGGWTVREMAVFDDKNNMIAIGNVWDIEKIISVNGSYSEMELVLKLAVSNQETLEFIIDPYAIQVTQKDLEKHNMSKIAHKELFDMALGDIDCGYFTGNPPEPEKPKATVGTFKAGECNVGDTSTAWS